MSAWFLGFGLVVLSAFVFGFALFGRRPVPQAATVGAVDEGEQPEPTRTTETPPSRIRGGQATAIRVRGSDGAVIVQPPREPAHLAGRDVRSPIHVRLRSTLVLLVGAVGTAVLLGAILSILLVGGLLLVV